MMPGPGDELTPSAAGRGHLRASHADREHVVDFLKVAFVQGRLTKAEFDQRVGHVLATYAELDALTADLPAAPTQTRLPEPARAGVEPEEVEVHGDPVV